MNPNEMTGDDLLTLLDTPAPIWLAIGLDTLASAIVRGNGWMLVYDQGRQSTWRGAMVCRPMPGVYADNNGVDRVVVKDDGTWTIETVR